MKLEQYITLKNSYLYKFLSFDKYNWEIPLKCYFIIGRVIPTEKLKHLLQIIFVRFQ